MHRIFVSHLTLLENTTHTNSRLQGALGELAYESDAAERLRHQLRATTAKAAGLGRQLGVAREEAAAAEAAARAAQQEAGAARQTDASRLDLERRLQV